MTCVKEQEKEILMFIILNKFNDIFRSSKSISYKCLDTLHIKRL